MEINSSHELNYVLYRIETDVLTGVTLALTDKRCGHCIKLRHDVGEKRNLFPDNLFILDATSGYEKYKLGAIFEGIEVKGFPLFIFISDNTKDDYYLAPGYRDVDGLISQYNKYLTLR